MQFLFSLVFGALIAVSSTLVHQTLPPVGVSIGIFATYLGIWYVGYEVSSILYTPICQAWPVP